MISLILMALFSQNNLAEGCVFTVPEPSQSKVIRESTTQYLRCHPTRNLVFTTELNEDGQTTPMMIDMESGTKRRVVTPALKPLSGTIPQLIDTPLTSGLAAAVSPQGRLIYVDLYENNQSRLGVFTLSEDNSITQVTQVPAEDFQAFEYPSPIYREGVEMIMYRTAKNLYLKKAETDYKKITITAGKQICPNILNEANTDQPAMAGNGRYLGVSVQGEMQILELDWAHVTDRSIPCRLKRKLPMGAGRPSFSDDGSRLVFHADALENLGKSANVVSQFNSYLTDVETGSVAPITNVGAARSSKFPAFCGSDRIAVRVSNDNSLAGSEFRILPAPACNAN